jgi:hypothetical protein
MAALFALGVMSVGWMAFVAALIAVEKLLPWKAVANRSIALLLAVLGTAVAFTPGSVPGLTLPDSAQARDAMMHMNGPAMTDENETGDHMSPSMDEPRGMTKPSP